MPPAPGIAPPKVGFSPPLSAGDAMLGPDDVAPVAGAVPRPGPKDIVVLPADGLEPAVCSMPAGLVELMVTFPASVITEAGRLPVLNMTLPPSTLGVLLQHNAVRLWEQKKILPPCG